MGSRTTSTIIPIEGAQECVSSLSVVPAGGYDAQNDTPDWMAFIRARGLKLTGQRQAVVEAFASVTGHASLEDIFALARERSPSIGLATIYRTMRLLEEAGLVERHDFEGGCARFEPTLGRRHHDHLICRGCGLIREFESDEIEALQATIADSMGFAILGHRHEIYGLCRDCFVKRAQAEKEIR